MLQRNTEFFRLREKSGLSIDEAANLLQVSDRTIRRYEVSVSQGSEPGALAMDLMRRLALATVHQMLPSQSKFKFIDLFAGIGGLRRPFESIGGERIFTAE